MAQGDGVKVDLGVLTQFANDMGNEADMHMGFATGYDKNMAEQITNLRAASAPGFQESQSFAVAHGEVAAAAGQFMMDVARGCASYGAGAETCALRYAGTDHFTASQLEQIAKDITAGGKNGTLFGSLDFKFSGTATDNAGVVGNTFNANPPGTTGLFITDNGNTPAPKDAPKETADPAQQKKDDAAFNAQVKKDVTDLQNGGKIDKVVPGKDGGYLLDENGVYVWVPKNQIDNNALDPNSKANAVPQPVK